MMPIVNSLTCKGSIPCSVSFGEVHSAGRFGEGTTWHSSCFFAKRGTLFVADAVAVVVVASYNRVFQ